MGWILMCRRRAWLPGWWMWCAMVVAMLSISAALAAPTVLDFEDLAPGTTVTTQYAARGVIFHSAFLSIAPLFSPTTVARSGTRGLRSGNPIHEFHTPPLVITFTSPQRRVRLFGGSEVVPISGTLRAFDAANTVVGVEGPTLVAANVFTTMFEVTVPTPRITWVELQYEGVAFEAIDDLEFEGEPLVQVTEVRQRSVTDDPAVMGNFPQDWLIPDAGAGLPPPPPDGAGVELFEFAEKFARSRAPRIVQEDLAPGATRTVELELAGPSGLAGLAQWIGTVSPLGSRSRSTAHPW